MMKLRKDYFKNALLANLFFAFMIPLNLSATEKFKHKEKEICEAALEASDAGWAAYTIVKEDVSAISISGEACTSREYATKKCESSVSQLVSNNLDHLMLQSFALRYINKLNALCAPYIHDSKGKLKFPKYDKVVSGSIVKTTETELIRAGYTPAGESTYKLKELPSKKTFELTSTYFKKPNSSKITHGCYELSVSAFASMTDTDPELVQINGLFPLSICFDLTKDSTSEEFSKALSKILQSRIK